MRVVCRRQPTAAALARLVAPWLLAALVLSGCGSDDQPDISIFCERLEIAFGPEGALAADYSDDPSAAEAVVEELEAVRRVAPLEIEPSLVIVNETARLIIAAFSEADSASLDAERLEESAKAAADLAGYSAEHCGLALDWESPVVFVDPDRIPGEVKLDVRG